MKKLTMELIENALREGRPGDGKVHIVVSKEEVKCYTSSSFTESIKSNDFDHICSLHAKKSLLDNAVAFGNKTGLRNGDLSDRINDYLIEKGYKLED